MRVRPNMVGSDYIEMPELDMEEAKSLFCRSSNSELRSEVVEGLMIRCVERCYFGKDDGSGSYHYHPLSLDVLGKQLGCIEPEEWEAHLDKIDVDIFNHFKETSHPVFSILRKSYDALCEEDQLLLMNAALFLPEYLDKYSFDPLCYNLNMFEWLGMVHGSSVDGVMRGLERLKRKSLLERLGDGVATRIGMHDLWRAFCEAELRSGDLQHRRWVYEEKRRSALVETSPSGCCWENMKRMAFLGRELSTLERVNCAHFSNVTVMKILRLELTKEVVLDLSGLTHLKSLELTGSELHRLVMQGLLRCLIFLRLYSCDCTSPRFVKQVECLTELQHMELISYPGDMVPDMRRMVSMRVAAISGCENVVTLTGLSTKLSNLRVLHLGWFSQLRDCSGMGDLVALEELCLRECRRLKRLPNLGKLRNLRKLDVSGCPLIIEVPGLGDLVALEELYAGRELSYVDFQASFKLMGFSDQQFRLYWQNRQVSYSLLLPEISKLRNLRILRFRGCRLEAVPGLESLISLQEVEADFREVVDKPSLRQLTKLQTLKIGGWRLEGLREVDDLVMLRSLKINDCSGVDKLPDFQSLSSLQMLTIYRCQFKEVSGLSNLIALESLRIVDCEKLERLPDLQRLTRLKSLDISCCGMLRRWDSTDLGQVEGGSCMSGGTCVGSDLPGSQTVMGLRTLRLLWCSIFKDARIIGSFSNLETLECRGLDAVSELPDLSNFPRLK